MNTAVTSKEEILRVSRDFLQRQGWESINIRTIAKECKISVDSIYNYFQNKTDLITATVESVWHPLHCIAPTCVVTPVFPFNFAKICFFRTPMRLIKNSASAVSGPTAKSRLCSIT